MNRQTSIDLDNSIIDAFRWNVNNEDFITTRQLIDKNPFIQAALYRAQQRGVRYNTKEEEDFLDYRIRCLFKSESGLYGSFRSLPSGKPFAISQEWVGPFVVNGWGQKKKLRAWVKREKKVPERQKREVVMQ